jgi:hypothetical protein
VTRFVVDCETLLRIAAGEIEVSVKHRLVAPTLVRSQASRRCMGPLAGVRSRPPRGSSG